jgi:hypothetical protein
VTWYTWLEQGRPIRASAHADLFWHDWHTALSCGRHNVLWCCFVHPEARRHLLNFDEEAPRMVATLRASFAQHLNEPAWTGFVQELSEASPEFAELWARHEVASAGSRIKHFLHSKAGLLRLRSTSLDISDMPETRIVVYTPVDDDSRERLPLTRLR